MGAFRLGLLCPKRQGDTIFGGAQVSGKLRDLKPRAWQGNRGPETCVTSRRMLDQLLGNLQCRPIGTIICKTTIIVINKPQLGVL